MGTTTETAADPTSSAPLVVPEASTGGMGNGGFYGDMSKAYDPPRDPLTTPADPKIIFRDIPVSVAVDWDPVTVGDALRQHLMGMFTSSALLVDALLGDPRVQATMMTRTAALFGQPVEHTKSDADGDGSVLAAWKECWPRIGDTGTMSEVLRWQIMMGFSLNELPWDTSEDLWVPQIKPWNPQFTWYNIVTRRYIAISYDGSLEVTPGDGKWALYAPHGDYRAWIHGCVRSVASPWLSRQYTWRDWARFCEVHGIPIMKATVPAMGDAIQKQRFQSSLANLGSESVVMTPEGIDGQRYNLELIEARDTSWQAFQGMLDRCDMSIVLPLLGQNLTTEVKEGSFAAARVHGDVRQNIVEADNAGLSRWIYTQIARPFALYNFGDADKAPRTRWMVDPVEDQARLAQMWASFGAACEQLSRAGVEFDPNDIARSMGLKVIPSQPTPKFQGSGAAPGAPVGK